MSIAIVLAVVLAAPFSVHGEMAERDEWDVGLKIGGSSYTATGDSLGKSSSRTSMTISGIITYPFGRRDWFALQTDQNVGIKGWSTSNSQVDHAFYNFAVLGKFALGKFLSRDRSASPYVSIGPYLATGQSGEDTKTLDWGYTPSITVELFGPTRLLLTFQSHISLRKAVKGQDIKYRTHSWLIGFQI
jgi:hypothetical protein